MDRAGAAGGYAAAELRAGEPKNVAQIPKHRHRRIAVKGLRLPVHMQSDHLSSLSQLAAAQRNDAPQRLFWRSLGKLFPE
jgi:hypothetical protein